MTTLDKTNGQTPLPEGTIPPPSPERIVVKGKSHSHMNSQDKMMNEMTQRDPTQVEAVLKVAKYDSEFSNGSKKSNNMVDGSQSILDASELEQFNGVFQVGDKMHLFSINALHCMTQNNPLRQFCVKVVVNKWFDRFIIVCILLNSLGLASKEHKKKYDAAYHSRWNEILDYLDLAFSIIFLVECILKVIAMGFIKHKRAYLRDAWNWIDFIIVVVSVIGFTPISNDSSMKAFRTMRILRPLRSMHKLKSMRNLLNTFFASIPGLFNVCVFQMFIFTIFAIVAVNFFSGAQYQFCRTTENIINDGVNKPYWPINEDAAWQCSSDDMCSGYPNYLGDGVVAKCGDIYRDGQLDPIAYDNAYNNEMINYDITNFNSVVASSLTIFQVITLEGWTQLMYNYQDTVSPVTSSIFFAVVIILGAFTTLNLILSSIMQSYLEQERKENIQREKEIKQMKSHLIRPAPGSQNGSSNLLIGEYQINSHQSSFKLSPTKPISNSRLSIIEEISASRQYNDHKDGSVEESAEINVVRMSIDRGSNSVRVSQESSTGKKMSPVSGHLPMLSGNTLTRFKGILAHQDLEERIMNGSAALSDRDSSVEKVPYSCQSSRKSNQSFRTPSPMPSPSRYNSQPQFDALLKQGTIKPSEMSDERDKSVFAFNTEQSPSPQKKMLQPADSTEHLHTDSIDRIKLMRDSLTNEDIVMTEDNQLEFNAAERAGRSCCYSFFYEIVISVTFNFCIYCFIMGNTITLASYRFDQSEEQTRILYILNSIFVWIFTVEMLAKLIGLGVKNYARDKFNLFDGIIVIVGLVDFTMSLTITIDEGSDGIMSAFRALRLLRVIKLARHWKKFQDILTQLISSVIDIANFSLLLLLVLFIFALLGMELFAFTAYEDINGDLVFGEKNIQEAFERGDELNWPRVNFNNVFQSLVTVFIIVLAEDWNGYMYLYVRALGFESDTGRTMALIYFITLFIIGNTIMLALFTALLLKSQESDIARLKDVIDKKESRTATKQLSSEIVEIQKEETPCDKIKGCCNRKACSERLSSFSDSFVRIFGGDSALDKLQKKRRQKDPKSNASPSSGNASIPSNSVMPEIKLDVAPANEERKQGEMSIQEQVIEDAPDPVIEAETEPVSLNELASLLQSDITCNVHGSVNLCRPHALLHYDFSNSLLITKGAKRKPPMILTGKSLYIFGPKNCFRRFCGIIATNFWFDMVIILFILVSTVTLAFEHPLEDPKSSTMEVLAKIDYGFTAVFCLEATLKIITLGFIMNGKNSYLLDSWNILDFIIVVFSLLGLVISADLSVVKVLRVARILRPLRLIQHAEGLKIATLAFFKAIPEIMAVQVVIFFCMFMISILMTSLLSGKLFSCNLDHSQLSYAQQGVVTNKWDCLNYGGEWVTAPLNFDNTLHGMLTLFIFQTREGWVGLMENSVDAVGVNQVGEPGRNWLFVVLYMILVIILCLLFVNYLVRIVIVTYNQQKNYVSFNALLSDQQRSWIQVQLMTYAVRPRAALQSDAKNCIRNMCIKIAKSPYFDNVIMVFILLNTLVMGLTWFDEPKELPEAIEIFNYVFMIVFTLEAIIKLFALKLRYFSDSWNRFDFIIVTFTLVMLILKMLNIQVPFGNGPTVLRALRIGRILRLIKRAKQLKIIFYTLLDSATSLGSLGLLLIIMFFMFAIIGRSLFGMAQIGGPMEELNEHVNFRDFGTSFLLLLRCSTGESWHMIMFDYARAYSPQYQCRDDEDYESLMLNGGPKACGSALYAYPFFIVFNFLVFQIFINLFVAIIIDAFLGQTDHFSLPIQNYQLEEFVSIWQEFDPDATGFISIDDLDLLVIGLAKSRDGQELIIKHEQLLEDDTLRRRFLALLKIPMYDQMKKVMFYDVIQQLCDKVNLSKFNEERMKRDRSRAIALKKMGLKGIKSDLEVLMTAEDSNAIDFQQTVRSMGSLNPKIKLMTQLQQGFKRVHETYAIYVDSSESITMRDEERRAFKVDELREKLQVQRGEEFDVNLLTTRHYFAGLIIQKCWKKKLELKVKRQQYRNERNGSRANSEGMTNASGIICNSLEDNSSARVMIECNQEPATLMPNRIALVGFDSRSNEVLSSNSKRSAIRSRVSSTNTNQLVGEELERIQKEDNTRSNILSQIKSTEANGLHTDQ